MTPAGRNGTTPSSSLFLGRVTCPACAVSDNVTVVCSIRPVGPISNPLATCPVCGHVELVRPPVNGSRLPDDELVIEFGPNDDFTDSYREGDPLVVLGLCPHGVDLDREFCPEGCRV